ncbi:MAG: DUF4384 domain-containing protein [Treponema sp.]|nr:DUF4384 domain-containing protein [Treponema sp.]
MVKRLTILVVPAFIAILSCATRAGKLPAEEGQAAAVNAVNLEEAIGEFSGYIAGRLPGDALTAVMVTGAPVQRLGDYIADKLAEDLLDIAGLRMVSRQDYERIFAEQNIQASLYFNDDSTAKIGRNLGWQTVIFGAVEPLSDAYRLSLRAVDVETGELLGTRNYILNGRDPLLICLVNPDVTAAQLAERETLLLPFDGKLNSFELDVFTDKPVYYDNELLFINLRASEDCYFVVYHLDASNNVQVIYPNIWEKNSNFLKAGVARVIPEGSSYLMREPYGEERILVYACDRPVNIPEDQYRSRSLSRGYAEAALSSLEAESGETAPAENGGEIAGGADGDSPGQTEAGYLFPAGRAEAGDTEAAGSSESGGLDSAGPGGEGPAQYDETAAGEYEKNDGGASAGLSGSGGKDDRGITAAARRATAQASYTILPGK